MVTTPGQAPPRPKASVDAPPAPPEAAPQEIPSLLAKKRWPRRLLVTLNIFIAVCLLGSTGAYGYLYWNFHRIPRGARITSAHSPGKTMNVLLIGSDTRSTISKAERKKFGSDASVGGQRSDTIMILHVDPGEKKAAILSLPRDLYVPIASGGSERINTAFDKGFQNLIDTIRNDFGIPIDHYVEVDFNGFRGVVQAVGDVNVYFPAPARDTFSGLFVKQAGCINLGGDGALSYVRSRHYQYFEGGRWHDEGDGDLGRIQRQQDFIRRVLRKVKGVRNPFTLNELINTGIHNVTIDNQLSVNDIVTLAGKFKSLSPDTVDMETLPTVSGAVTIGGQNAAILRPNEPDAQAVIDRFLGKAPPPDQVAQVPQGVAPTSIRLRVLNGAGVSGLASKAAGSLGPSGVGMNIAGTGDADSFRYIQSVVSYGPGQLPKAQFVQGLLKSPAQLKEDPKLKAVDLVLTVGNDFPTDGSIRPLAGQSTTPTSTAPPTTAGGTTATTTAPPGNATGKSAAESC